MSLVREAEVDAFIAKVKKAYAPYKELEGERLHEVIFATKPSTGAYGECVLLCMSGGGLIGVVVFKYTCATSEVGQGASLRAATAAAFSFIEPTRWLCPNTLLVWYSSAYDGGCVGAYWVPTGAWVDARSRRGSTWLV